MTDDCTCHPYDNPPRPCPQKYALGACRLADAEARADHALALVAEAYEVAAASLEERGSDGWVEHVMAEYASVNAEAIRSLTPSTALAAREARDKRVRDEALRDERGVKVKQRGREMSDDLIERLLRAPLYEASGEESDLPDEVADRIRELEAENKALREALDAMLVRHVIYCGGEDLPFAGHTDKKLLDLARAALAETEGE